ncbi:MAG: hypothetical protein K8I60_07320, partial [Anaerolineae bacterium]|nr:hypothetical protein [Anaerolineae bacterium]
TPSGLTVDGFQVIHGSVLSPGVYNDFLASSGGLLNTTGTWTTVKNARAYGGTYIRSNTQNDRFTFDFDGTGFSIVTQSDARGVDFRLCYVLQGDFDGAFDGSGTETCQNLSTDTTLADWRAANGTRPLPVGYAYQYGFDVYGLPAGIYTAEVRIQDGTILVPYDYLNIDAVTIFGDVSNGGAATPLTPGQLYDDTDVMSVDYAPGHTWTLNSAYRYGPWRGPWNRTEHMGKNAGTVMQVYLQGNALVLYQTGSTRNSNNIRVCLATNEGPQCSEFSQYVRPTYFTPVVFYGLGDGKHTLIFENQDHLRPFSVDAMQVLP